MCEVCTTFSSPRTKGRSTKICTSHCITHLYQRRKATNTKNTLKKILTIRNRAWTIGHYENAASKNRVWRNVAIRKFSSTKHPSSTVSLLKHGTQVSFHNEWSLEKSTASYCDVGFEREEFWRASLSLFPQKVSSAVVVSQVLIPIG